MSNKLGQTFDDNNNDLDVYGTAGNPYGKMMVGGQDAEALNNMLSDAYKGGVAGGDTPLTKIGEYKGRSVFEQQAADQVRISLDDNGKAYVKLSKIHRPVTERR